MINRLSWNNVSFNLCLLVQVYKWNLLEVEIFQKIKGWNITYDCFANNRYQRNMLTWNNFEFLKLLYIEKTKTFI